METRKALLHLSTPIYNNNLLFSRKPCIQSSLGFVVATWHLVCKDDGDPEFKFVAVSFTTDRLKDCESIKEGSLLDFTTRQVCLRNFLTAVELHLQGHPGNKAPQVEY